MAEENVYDIASIEKVNHLSYRWCMDQLECSFLADTVPILIIDSDPVYQQWYLRVLGQFSFYKLVFVATQAEAIKELHSKTRYHLVITELERDEAVADEFEVLKLFAETVPFLVVSVRDSLERGFAIGNYGAMAIELKPVKDESRFVSLVNKYFLDSLLAPGKPHIESDYLKHYLLVFNKYHPQSVDSWSEHAGLPMQFLVRNWEREFAIHPTHIVCLHTLFRFAMGIVLPYHSESTPSDAFDLCKQTFLQNRDFYVTYLFFRNQ
jgi:CheY-like chemotaxis protein